MPAVGRIEFERFSHDRVVRSPKNIQKEWQIRRAAGPARLIGSVRRPGKEGRGQQQAGDRQGRLPCESSHHRVFSNNGCY